MHTLARKACGGLYSLAGGEKSDDFSNHAEPTFRSLAATGAWEPFLRSREDVAEFDPGAPDEVAKRLQARRILCVPASLELRAAAMMRRQRRIIIVSDSGASLLHWLPTPHGSPTCPETRHASHAAKNTHSAHREGMMSPEDRGPVLRDHRG
jgi:hypothetical protein